MAKTYYAHIVHWIKEDPESPGYIMSRGVEELLQTKNTPEIVNPKFYNQEIFEKFLETQYEVEWFTSVATGLVTFVHKNDVSLIIFDDKDKLDEYNLDKRELSVWPIYEKARDDFLKLLKIKIKLHTTAILEADTDEELKDAALKKISEILKE